MPSSARTRSKNPEARFFARRVRYNWCQELDPRKYLGDSRRHVAGMTTRAKATEEQLATIVAMLEDQRQRQELLMQRNEELAKEQRKYGKRLAELDKLRESVRGLAATLEEQARVVEEPLAGGDPKRTTAAIRLPVPLKTEKTEKKPLGPGVELRPDVEEFVPGHEGSSEDPLEEHTRTRDARSHIATSDGAGAQIIRPTPYDGRTAWDAYKTQFAMLAKLNGWSDAEKATYLAINLKRPALTVLSNLPEHHRRNYGALTAALDARFGVAHQRELHRVQLRNRRRRHDEGMPELAENVERLARLAYPRADAAMVEVLAKDQFIDALPQEDMRLCLRQMRPSSLREALQHALELQSFMLAGQQSSRPVRGTRMDPHAPTAQDLTKNGEEILKSMQECVTEMQECAKGFEGREDKRKEHYKPRPKGSRDSIVCWGCQQKGHICRNCTNKPRGKPNPTRNQNQGNDQ